MDEFTEFSRGVMEAMRQPLEDKKIVISRKGGTYSFPADFILLASMNVVGQKVIQPTIRVASLIGLKDFDNKEMACFCCVSR